jgi:hypothetical protein
MIRLPLLVLLCLSSLAAGPKLAITEIMYDPASPESDNEQTEWVEIHNFGQSAIALQGFELTSGTKFSPHALRQKYVFRDVTIAPGAYLVVGIGSPSMYEPYGLPPFRVYVGEGKYAWFTNSGDSVAIRDSRREIIDEVVYSTDSPWPAVRNGGSIQFIAPPGTDPQVSNDQGKNWIASSAATAEEFKRHGYGTPGKPPRFASTRPSTQPSENVSRRDAVKP